MPRGLPCGSVVGGLWSIKLEKAGCIGCGICAAACPTGALRVEGVADGFASASTPGPVVLECRRVPQESRVDGSVAVPCLGGMALPDLMEQAAAGVRIMDRGWCADCAVGQCAAPWEPNLDSARELLAFADPASAERLEVVRAGLPASAALPVQALRPDMTPNRRDFFRRLVAPPPEPHGPDESQRIIFGRGLVRPHSRERILAALRALAEGTAPPETMPAVTIDASACDLHGICAAICPTGALRLTQPSGTTMAIDYDAEACISCNECARVCPGKALRLNAGGDGTVPTGRETLVTRARGICMGCGDSFPQDDSGMQLYCTPCRNSRSLMQDMTHLRAGRFPQV